MVKSLFYCQLSSHNKVTKEIVKNTLSCSDKKSSFIGSGSRSVPKLITSCLASLSTMFHWNEIVFSILLTHLETIKKSDNISSLVDLRQARCYHDLLSPVSIRPVPVYSPFRPAAGVRRKEPRRLHDGAEAGAEDEEGLDAHGTKAVGTLRSR